MKECKRRNPGLSEVTVASSPYAVGVYERIGFASTGPERELDGIKFTPMIKSGL